MKICVQTQLGLRGEETPCAFHLGGCRLHVLAVLQRWTDAMHRYFEVAVDDGRRFVLRFEPATRGWELTAVFAAAPRKPAAKPAGSTRPRKFFFSLAK